MAVDVPLDVLEPLGLTPNEAKVYLALCETGPAGASAVAEKCSVNRTLMYDTLTRLVSKGFVSVVDKDGKKVFQAANPARLSTVFEEREALLKRTMEGFITTVRGLYAPAAQPNVSIFLGVEGLKNVLVDQIATLNKGDVVRAYRAQSEITRLAPLAASWFKRKHAEKGIAVKAIVDSSPDGVEKGKTLASHALTDVRYLPVQHEAPITYEVYGDKTAILSAAEGQVFSLIIQSQPMARFFAEDFDRTWNALSDKPAKNAPSSTIAQTTTHTKPSTTVKPATLTKPSTSVQGEPETKPTALDAPESSVSSVQPTPTARPSGAAVGPTNAPTAQTRAALDFETPKLPKTSRGKKNATTGSSATL